MFKKKKSFNTDVLLAALDKVCHGSIYWMASNGAEAYTPELEKAVPVLASDNPVSPYSQLLQIFDAGPRDALDKAVRGLRKEGTEFKLTLEALNKNIYDIHGYQTSTPKGKMLADVVTLIDQTHVRNQLNQYRGQHQEVVDKSALVQTMIDNVPIPMWIRGKDFGLVMKNKAYQVAVGREEGAEIAKGMAGEDGLELARLVAEKGAATSKRGNLVLAGKRKFVEVFERPVMHQEAGDENLLSIGYVRDITQLAAIQKQMMQAEEGHEKVLEAMINAIAIYGPDKRLLFSNSAFRDLWQLDNSFVRTKPSLSGVLDRLRGQRVFPEHSNFPEFKKSMENLFTSLIEPKEELYHLPDGRTFRQIIAPHPQGGLLFLFEDVSENLQLTSSYNTLIQVQRETLDNLHEGVAVYGGDGRLKLSNPTYRKMWPLPSADADEEFHISDVVENNQTLFDYEGDWAAEKTKIMAQFNSRQGVAGRMERIDGHILDYSYVPLPDGAMLLSYVDVTDQFKVERALRERNEALEAADRMKSDFIANVSYGLRTPLNALMGFAEILNQELFGELNDKQHEYTGGIMTASTELKTLIDDVVDLAAIEAGYMQLHYESFDVYGLVQSVHAMLSERAASKNIEMPLNCNPNIGALQADPRRIKQALFNVASNAVEFTPENGKVSIMAAIEGPAVVMTVIDTGPGIPANAMARIFERFEKLGDTRRGGAGLGLPLVKSFMEMHGGDVHVESEVGKGTTVTLTIPLAPAAEVSLPAPDAAAEEEEAPLPVEEADPHQEPLDEDAPPLFDESDDQGEDLARPTTVFE